jgi:glycosyltransferase involved in cell wall biosynthesis
MTHWATLCSPLMDVSLPLRVAGVCGGYGFPHGHASTRRILLIGRALQTRGIAYKVFHCGPSPVHSNTQIRGTYKGIDYIYTTDNVKRPENRALRFFLYAKGFAKLARLLRSSRNSCRICVHLFAQGDLLGLVTGVLCRACKIPLVQEVNEWWPGLPECDALSRWMYGGPMLRWAQGALVVSHEIERRVTRFAQQHSGKPLVHRLPVLVDFDDFAAEARARSADVHGCDFLWCGLVDAYMDDIFFLIRALALARRSNTDCRLLIAGACNDRNHAKIRALATATDIPPEALLMLGYISDESLRNEYRRCVGLCLPLWNDDRSRTRMPTKLGEYLASGTPVISSKIGEPAAVLQDGVNAFLAEPGNPQAFADSMARVAADPKAARQIGGRGRLLCRRELDYRDHAQALAEFFQTCSRAPGGNRQPALPAPL